MAWRVVLHQEPSGGAIPTVQQKKAREEGKLFVGSLQSVEQARGHRGGASEAGAAWPQWTRGLPHLLPPSSCPTGREEATDVGILQPNGSRPRVTEGVAKGRSLESTRPSAATKGYGVP